MDIYNTKPLTGQPPFPARDLWRALLEIRNHYFVEILAGYIPIPDVVQPPRPVVEALWLLDCWLDIAVGEGWTDVAREQLD